MLIFSLTVGIRKERRKKQQCQLQQWSLTVTAALAILSTVFFLIFFSANNQHTPSRHCCNIDQDQNNVNVRWGSKAK